MVTYFKTLSTGTVNSGSYAEKTWTPDTDITINKVLLVERDDKSLSNVQVFIKIAGDNYAYDYVPAAAIGQDLEYCWKPNLTVRKGAEIYFKIQNSRADSISVDIVLEVTK